MDPNTDVVVIHKKSDSGRSNILLGPDKHAASNLNIIIKKNNPLTIVISHKHPMVIHFSGYVEHVKKVVAMGSTKAGWDHVAVTGIGAEKLHFFPVIGRHKDLGVDCGSPPDACLPQQYFTVDTKRPEYRNVQIDETRKRIAPALEIYATGDTVSIPPEKAQIKKQNFHNKNYPSGWRGELKRYQDMAGIRKNYELEKLASPTVLENDFDLPSWEGIAQLIKTGEIRETQDYELDPDLQEFSETHSVPYRNRFDPDFSFQPKIDLVLTPSFEGNIPRDLRHSERRSIVFLGTKSPEPSEKGDKGKYCIFYQDDNSIPSNIGSDKTSNKEKLQCKPHHLKKTSGFYNINTETLPYLQMEAMQNIVKHRRWNTKLCRLLDIPEKAEVVVLSTAYGRTKDNITRTRCRAKGSFQTSKAETVEQYEGKFCKFGTVDVEINKPGPVFLFLKAKSAIEWQFKVSDKTEILGVATIGTNRQIVTGLPNGITFKQYVPEEIKLPDECQNQLIYAHPLAGGPAVMLFETMFEKISGRKIDMLLNKGAPPEKGADINKVSDYARFIVE